MAPFRAMMSPANAQRGMFFVDSANFYHSLKKIGVSLYHVDFAKLTGALFFKTCLV